MYNPGSIADRLRELQREADAAYARLNFVHSLLGESYNKIHDLVKENTSLRLQVESLVYRPETKIPLSSEHKISDIPDNTEYQTSDISDDTKSEDSGKPKKAKRN